MDETDRKTLQVNRSFVVKNLQNPDDVNNELFERELFSEGMKDEVEVEKQRDRKVRKILDILPRRGPQAFQIFLEVLSDTHNSFIAQTLQTGAQIKYASNKTTEDSDEDLPETWPDPVSLEQPVSVRMIPQQSDMKNKKQRYKMEGKPRGRVLMINNKIFYGPKKKDKDGHPRVTLATREGTDEDEKRVTDLFKQLYFIVDARRDQTAKQIREILLEEVKRDFHRDAECFVFILMTHGTHGGVYGVDGETISIEEIKRQLNGENFPMMATKPKLLFLQACRGEDRDEGITEVSSVNDKIKEAANKLKDLSLGSQSDSGRETVIPTMSHMLTATASTLGMVSYRNRMYGSWFLQAVVFIFSKYSYKDDINQLLIKVNNLVSKGKAKDSNTKTEYVATSEFSSTLSKSFYFNPGISTDTVQQSRIQQASD